MEPEGKSPALGHRFYLDAPLGPVLARVIRTLSDGHILALMQGPVIQSRGKAVEGQDYVMLVHPQDIYKDKSL